jgi:hypothetical protein
MPQARCRDIRILSESFMAHVERRPCRVKSLGEAVGIVLPKPSAEKGFQTLRSSTLQRRLGCSQGHVKNLIDSGELRLAPFKTARCESPYILHESACTWLHRRALGHAAYAKSE